MTSRRFSRGCTRLRAQQGFPMNDEFPESLDLSCGATAEQTALFREHWHRIVERECREHPIWSSSFVHALADSSVQPLRRYQLAATWAINMVVGSYCFPRYVAALAARAQSDVVRHSLLENAWDESGGVHHRSRSHFWLAVRLARLLGLSDREIQNIAPLPAARRYTDEHYAAWSQLTLPPVIPGRFTVMPSAPSHWP